MNKTKTLSSGVLKGASLALLLALGTAGLSAQTFLHEGIIYKASGANLTIQKPGTKVENGDAPASYEGDIVIPATIEYNGKTYTVDKAGTGFKGQPVTSVEFPSTVTAIGIGGFQDCNLLERIVLPSGLAKLEQNTFTNCVSLKELEIPGSVTSIANNTIKHCTALEKLVLADGDTPLKFEAAMLNDSSTTNLKEVYIGRAFADGSAAAMADKPFRSAPALEKATLGANVTKMIASYFEGASKLKEVVILGEMTDLGTSTFAGTALEEITLPESVTSIPSGCFSGTKSLTTVNLGSAVTLIDAMAFQNSAVKNINLPATLKTINDMAFSGTKLEGELTLPEAVTKVGAQAFAKVKGLTKVSFPATFTTFGDGAFMGCENIAAYSVDAANEKFETDATGAYIVDKEGTKLYAFAPKAAMKELELGVAAVAPYACYGATALETVKLDDCTDFGNYSFAGTGIKALTVRGLVGRYVAQACPELTEVTIEGVEAPIGIVADCPKVEKVNLPSKLTVVKQDAFSGTPALKELNLGTILAIIEAGAFDNTGIETLTVGATFPAVMPEGVFTAAHSGITVKVPVDLVDTYKGATGWSNLNIVGDANLAASGADMGMPDGLYYAGKDGLLHCVYSDGETDTYDVGGIPHTFQLLEFKNRIYGACAGDKFVYSATGATDGDGKLFYISKVGGETFQAVVLDNAGGNAYQDPFGLYIYGDTLYVNDRNVCIRKIPADAIALPKSYPSWMENNWMSYYGNGWSYGCIKSGFAITTADDADEPVYWVGMKYNGNGIFRFREGNIGNASGAGPAPKEKPIMANLNPIFTTFQVDPANNDFYIYIEIAGSSTNYVKGGLYRIKLDKLDANATTDNFADFEAELIDGAPVYREGSGTNEHVGISQLAIDEKGGYLYWCYRQPTEAQVEQVEGYDNSAEGVGGGYYMWAEKFDAENPRHKSGIKRIKLGEENPVVETVVEGVEGYGVVAVNYEGSTKPEEPDSVINIAPAAQLVTLAGAAITANVDLTLEVYNAAGLLITRKALAAGETFSAQTLEAGVYVAVATADGAQQVVKLAK